MSLCISEMIITTSSCLLAGDLTVACFSFCSFACLISLRSLNAPQGCCSFLSQLPFGQLTHRKRCFLGAFPSGRALVNQAFASSSWPFGLRSLTLIYCTRFARTFYLSTLVSLQVLSFKTQSKILYLTASPVPHLVGQLTVLWVYAQLTDKVPSPHHLSATCAVPNQPAFGWRFTSLRPFG